MDINYYSFLTSTSVLLLLQYYCLIMASSANIDTDRAALLALRSQLNLEPYHVLSINWSDSSPVCSWVGVTCGSRHQRVTELNISKMGIATNLIPQILGNLSFLVSLDLSRNKFQGNLPKELTQLRRLQILDLSRNNISGQLPSWFGSFPKLRSVDISNNSLTGILPPSLSNLSSSLEVLGLLYNYLQGGIPQEIGDLRNLQQLSLQGNQLTGSIPIALFNIPKLKLLSLSDNRLQGPIPREVGNSTLLERLYLANNNLTGEIPSSLLNISTLRWLYIDGNQLTGNLTSSFGHGLPYLEVLGLVGNYLTSESPDLSFINSLTNCRHLKKIGIADNRLNGILPSSIGNLSASLESIFAYNCGLHGRIPDEIGNLTNLIILTLFDNNLTGSLPETLGNMQSLQGLDLQRNKIDGNIPNTMCNCLYLFGVVLNNNQIGDALPNCIGNITSLRILQLNNNKLNSTLPPSLWHLKDLQKLSLSFNSFVGSLAPDIGNLRVATLIDLSMNQFSGNIPSTVAELSRLNYFLLNNNKFQGSIPDSISQMVNLEILDLSQNNLSGVIPASLEKLPYLDYFNVSYNDLSGEIPSGGPFQNFTSQSFLSNEGLCGDIKYHVPPCQPINVQRSKSKSKLHIVLILIGTLGIVLAMISLTCIFSRQRGKASGSITSYHESIPTPVRFSYSELLEATNGYDQSNLLGRGSFGSVYRGILRDGKDVAVKVFNLQSEGASNSFEVECEVLRKLRHRNLCKVIGSCSNHDFKALVLEYMPGGSLEKWLYSHNYFLNVIQRITIMIDIAHALEYLHYGYSTPIIHCDLKPGNILLDADMAAHLGDFGIAKLLNDGESAVHTLVLATLGYIAPEFGLEGLVSTRCDVYSYGIILMEVFTRMKPSDEKFAGNLSLRSWVKEYVPDGITQIIDSNLLRPHEGLLKEKLNCFSSIFELALSCSMESPSERINIKDARVALEKIKRQIVAYY